MHVHCLVTGGGVSDDGSHWHPARNGFLVPVRALAKLVRGKLKAALAKRRPDQVVPKAAWGKPLVVHCTAWGEGDEAVLRYLARYVFRVAITNSRIVGLDENGVTIRHKDRKSPACLGRRRRPCGQLNDFVCCFNAVIHRYPDYRVAFLNHHSSLFGSFSGRV